MTGVIFLLTSMIGKVLQLVFHIETLEMALISWGAIFWMVGLFLRFVNEGVANDAFFMSIFLIALGMVVFLIKASPRRYIW